MQVNLSFDTEGEKLENLKKLVDALQQLISSREGKTVQQPMQVHNAAQQITAQLQSPPMVYSKPPQMQTSSPDPMAIRQSPPRNQNSNGDGKTAGGCRVVPYEDMTGQMSRIFSGGR